MIIYRLLSVRQVIWRVFFTHDQTCRKQKDWSCGGLCLGWLRHLISNGRHAHFCLFDAYLQVIDFYVCWFYCLFRSQLLHTRPNSSVSRVSASWSKDRGFDPGFNSKIFFPQKMSEMIFSIMVPIGNNHILSESLWFDIMYSYIFLICSSISHMGL